jgi:prepilin-type N-terminal cleavage/methylation domain-containing protein
MRDGMSLIEVMMSLTLLTLLLTSQTALTMKFAQRQRTVALGASRAATLSSLINKYMTIPFDSLAVRTGCATVPASATVRFGYTRCVTVTAVNATESTVQIILTPAALTRVDTVVFRRGKVAAAGPLGA